MELRPYQTAVIDELSRGFVDGHQRQVLMMATGSGKTATAAEMIRRAAANGNRSLFVVDRKELVGQAVRHLVALGLQVGTMQAENTFVRPTDQVIVGTIQTIRARGVPEDIRLIVIDEVHIWHRAHADLVDTYSAIPVIGLSATPLRIGLAKHFSRLVKGPLIRDLIAQGFLVPTKAFGPGTDQINAILGDVQKVGHDFNQGQLGRAMNRKQLIGDIVSTWQAKADGRPTLCFAADIAHSKAIVDDFRAVGIAAEHIDAHTDDDERKDIIERFRSGDVTLLSSVYVLGIGFDVPIASCAILARPTLSLGLHIQQLGRVMRPAPGKDHALVLDHAGNFARHGRPEAFDVDTLDDGEDKAKGSKRTTKGLKPCTECGFMLEPDRFECPECGHERKRLNRVHYRDGDLHEIDGTERISIAIQKRDFYLELKWIAADRDYKPGWAAVKYRDKFGDWPPRAWQHLPAMRPEPATLRWVQSQFIAWKKSRQRDAAHA